MHKKIDMIYYYASELMIGDPHAITFARCIGALDSPLQHEIHSPAGAAAWRARSAATFSFKLRDSLEYCWASLRTINENCKDIEIAPAQQIIEKG